MCADRVPQNWTIPTDLSYNLGMTLDQKIIWNQLVCDDQEQAIAFYEALFGWTTKPEERKTYVHFYQGPDTVAGIMPQHGPSSGPSRWSVQVGTTDIERYCERAQAAGGKLLTPIMDIQYTGRLCSVKDPQGGVLTAFQPLDTKRKEWGNRNEVGHFCWVELLCQDLDKAIGFYTNVAGWEAHSMPVGDMTYHMLAPKGAGPMASIGGVMQMPEAGVPDHFLPYVMVQDVDASLAKAQSLGAQVCVQGTDIPGYGRFAVFADPQGAALAVFQPKC